MEQQKAGRYYNGKVCVHKNGGSVLPHYVTTRVKKFLTECGFEDFRPHDLRHTAGTFVMRHDSPKQAQVFLGHSSIQTTMDIYGHALLDDKIETAKSISNFYSVSFEGVRLDTECSESGSTEA